MLRFLVDPVIYCTVIMLFDHKAATVVMTEYAIIVAP